MSIVTAFTTPFTGASPRKSNATVLKTARRPIRPRTARAVMGSQMAPTSWDVETENTYEVTVEQKNKTITIEVDSETDLREALLSRGIDLYTLGGKLRNCNGNGQCGTCLISVEEGLFYTGDRTGREQFLLKNKPDSWRLACRTRTSGDIKIRTKPQA